MNSRDMYRQSFVYCYYCNNNYYYYNYDYACNCGGLLFRLVLIPAGGRLIVGSSVGWLAGVASPLFVLGQCSSTRKRRRRRRNHVIPSTFCTWLRLVEASSNAV